jgi:hypothetical protein
VPCPEKAIAFEGLRCMDAPKGTQAEVEGGGRKPPTETSNPPSPNHFFRFNKNMYITTDDRIIKIYYSK